MSSNAPFTGAVASLLNERELAINLGAEAGVQEGMRFVVLEKPRPIMDPVSKEELGSVQREKVKIKVVEVHPKFSIARTYETYQTTPSLDQIYGAIGAIGAFSKGQTQTRVRTLKVSDRPNGFEEIDEQDSYVQIGDPIQLIQIKENVAAHQPQMQKTG